MTKKEITETLEGVLEDNDYNGFVLHYIAEILYKLVEKDEDLKEQYKWFFEPIRQSIEQRKF